MKTGMKWAIRLVVAAALFTLVFYIGGMIYLVRAKYEMNAYARRLDAAFSAASMINAEQTHLLEENAIVAEYAALTNGKGMWWEITLPGDDQSVFFRAEPCEMRFPDVESAQAVQGAVQLIENQYAGWAAKST